jgi:acyl-CoA synthetase (AMP-forming)/AMP-acid ligase II
VQLADIERCVGQLAGIDQVVVTPIQGETTAGQRIAAFCVLRAGETLTDQQLRSACFELLPNYAIPDEVRVLKTLPMLPSGKVDRRSLAALLD